MKYWSVLLIYIFCCISFLSFSTFAKCNNEKSTITGAACKIEDILDENEKQNGKNINIKQNTTLPAQKQPKKQNRLPDINKYNFFIK